MHGHPPGPSAAHARVPITGSTGGSRRRAIPASLLALALLAGASACSSDANADPPDTTTTAPAKTTTTAAPTTTTTEPKSEEDEVVEAYLDAASTLYVVSLDPDPEDPRLAERRMGAALEGAKSVMSGYLDDGVSVKFVNDSPPIPDIQDVDVAGSEAEMKVCLIDDLRQVRVSDGEVINDAVSSRSQIVEMKQEEGRWMVAGGSTIRAWQDGKGCDR